MLNFDEKGLVRELTALSSDARIAFATAAATRQLGSYERFDADTQTRRRPREIALELWAAVNSPAVDKTMWSSRRDEVMALLPGESNIDWVRRALAEDAVSSLAYAIRCLLTSEPQEAVWAARRAYEAADQAAIRLLGAQPGEPSEEAQILSHELVQRELSRQKHDLSQLKAGLVAELQRRALADELLTSNEAEALVALS